MAGLERELIGGLIDAGANDAQIIAVRNEVRKSIGEMVDAGKSDQEIQNVVRQTKWGDKPVFKSAPTAQAPETNEPPTLVQNISGQLREGIRGAINPSSVQFPGSEALSSYGMPGEIARGVIGSALGASQAAYAIPSGIAQTYVTQPLRAQARAYTPKE